MSLHHEVAFEREICDQLGAHGWLYEERSAALKKLMGWVKLRSSKPRAVSMPTSASSSSWSRCWWPASNPAPASSKPSSPAPRCGFQGAESP